MTAPDFKTFDLAKALSGISFPEVEVPIFFDAQAAHDLALANRAADRETIGTPEFEEAEAKVGELIRKLKGSLYKFTLRGISRKRKQDMVTLVLAEVQAAPLGDARELAEREASERLQVLNWSHMIVKIEDPEGAVITSLTEEQAGELIGSLPDDARNTLEDEIDKMEKDTSAGYEIGITDFDFLSEASPEG